MKLSRLAAAAAAALLTGLLAPLLAACGTADAATPHTASLPGDGYSHATLAVLTGTAALKIGVASLGSGGPLLRVAGPAGRRGLSAGTCLQAHPGLRPGVTPPW